MSITSVSRLTRVATALAGTLGFATSASAQWAAVTEQFYLPAPHNWMFRAEYPAADRLFNAFDYGHAILYEVLWSRPSSPTSVLENDQYQFITRKLLINPPRFPLEEAAIAPDYSRLAPEAKAMFEWAHVLHRQIYDVLADERLSESQRDAQVAQLVAYYRTRPDLAFSSKPKGMTLMEGQPYSLAFRKRFPKFNGLIWGYHWLQVGLYDALLAGSTSDEKSALVSAAVARFRQMLVDPPSSLPHVMPMTPAIAPLFTKRYPEAAVIFDNLHSIHDVISDILANDAVPRDRKRAAILLAARRYRDDSTDVTSREEWIDMAGSMGLENQGGPAVGVLTAPAKPTAAQGATMPGMTGGHAGHRMPADTVMKVADSLSRSDAAVRQRLTDVLFKLLEDEVVQQRVAADSSLRRILMDLLPVIPVEHRDHYKMLLRVPPASPPQTPDRD